MKIVIFGLTISSSWGNGHATVWSSLCRQLIARGHHIVFFERDVPYYAAHRDLAVIDDGSLQLYQSWNDVVHPLCALPGDGLSFLLFPVEQPQFFDAVCTTNEGQVRRIQVKQQNASSNWIRGAFKMPGAILHGLHALWVERNRCDEYIGTLVNAWLEARGSALGIRSGESYVDVGTLNGYREAIKLLSCAQSNDSFPISKGFGAMNRVTPHVVA